MTSREAFEQWCYQPIVTNAFDVDDSGEYRNATVRDRWATWQAACEWQKQKDAEICKSLDPKPDEYSPDYEFTERRKVMDCAEAILNQGEK